MKDLKFITENDNIICIYVVFNTKLAGQCSIFLDTTDTRVEKIIQKYAHDYPKLLTVLNNAQSYGYGSLLYNTFKNEKRTNINIMDYISNNHNILKSNILTFARYQTYV